MQGKTRDSLRISEFGLWIVAVGSTLEHGGGVLSSNPQSAIRNPKSLSCPDRLDDNTGDQNFRMDAP
jgi:hypothetical protein